MRYPIVVFYFLCSVILFAQEPAANPTNLQFSNVKAYGFTLQFTPSAADGFLVLKSDKYINNVPADGIAYQKGEGVGNAKVISAGAATTINVREVLEGTKYYFAVFAFNGTGTNINYKQSNPLIDSVTSAGFNQDNYFAGIDSSSATFINDLHNLINPHTMRSYSPEYRTLVIPNIYERDTINGGAVINCEYSNETTVYTPPFDFTAQGYNREHVLCKSWMQTAAQYGANNLINYPEGADYHNLLLTRSTPNQTRSNHPLGIVVNVSSTYGSSKFGTDINGKPVFEPMDDRKGDAARCMFYQMICYNGKNGNWGLDFLLTEAPNQDQNILKLWNAQDPPDKFEKTKDEYIYSLQNNRNPFIAYPGWVNCINWDSLVKTNFCGAVSSVNDFALSEQLNIFPNPAGEYVIVELASEEQGTGVIAITDITGRIISTHSTSVYKGANQTRINTMHIESGNYILTIQLNGKSAYRHLVKF
jgi:endonuclease I